MQLWDLLSVKQLLTVPCEVCFFYTSIVIAFIGVIHSIDRVRGSFVIAAYLARFIEPKTPNIKWETRLKLFRDKSSSYGHHRLMSLNLSYVVIAWLNWFLGTGYLLREIQQNHTLHSEFVLWLIRIGIILTGLATVGLTWFAKSQHNKYITNYIKTYDDIWKKVEDSETNPS